MRNVAPIGGNDSNPGAGYYEPSLTRSGRPCTIGLDNKAVCPLPSYILLIPASYLIIVLHAPCDTIPEMKILRNLLSAFEIKIPEPLEVSPHLEFGRIPQF